MAASARTRSCRRALFGVAALLAGCPSVPPDGPPAGADEDRPEEEETPTPPARETDCDGLDDNQNGLVDEGFPDLDGDGKADCVDRDCEFTSEPPPAPELVAACVAADPALYDPWDAVVEWRWSGLAADPFRQRVRSSPLVGFPPSVSLPPDGTATPAVLALAWGGGSGQWDGSAVLLDGASGAELWDRSGVATPVDALFGDLNLDDHSEVVVMLPPPDTDWRIASLGPAGVSEWESALTSSPNPLELAWSAEGPLVWSDDWALDATSGVVSNEGGSMSPFEPPIRQPLAVDLDGDGVDEVAVGDGVFSSEGELLWQPDWTGAGGHWWIPLELDGELGAELGWLAGGELGLYDGDGALLSSVPVGASRSGPPCTADFDGDGEIEVGVASTGSSQSRATFGALSRIEVVELDGTLLWLEEAEDPSGLAGCAAFDFDGDGADELLYSDGESFRVFDGATGAVRVEFSEHRSGTSLETPTVADVDGDGSAEVVFVSDFGGESAETWSGVTVVGHREGRWPPTGGVWPAHGFREDRWDEFGRPVPPVPGAGPPAGLRRKSAWPVPHADVVLALGGWCWSGCDSESLLRVEVFVVNQGLVASGESVRVEVSGTSADSEPVLLEQVLLPGVLEPGDVSEPRVFEFRRGDLQEGMEFTVEAVGIEECNIGNNALLWTPPACGP